jgi:hypothetical protein
VQGQRVSFCAWRESPHKTITYYARVVGTGAYTAEPVVMQSLRAPESLGLTVPLAVVIE